MTNFYLVRHGHRDPLPGDPALNAVGLAQAERTASHLAEINVDAIYSSPLTRARQTMEPLAARLGLPVIEDVRLRERANFGDVPGQTMDEFVAMWAECDADRSFVPITGLSAQANGERAEAWMRGLALHPAGTVVAGTHGGTITDFLLNRFTEDELLSRCPHLRHMPNCAITLVSLSMGFLLQ
ncbi:MAG: histidine phosphatase family protein [Caldilineaceae bacterium]